MSTSIASVPTPSPSGEITKEMLDAYAKIQLLAEAARMQPSGIESTQPKAAHTETKLPESLGTAATGVNQTNVVLGFVFGVLVTILISLGIALLVVRRKRQKLEAMQRRDEETSDVSNPRDDSEARSPAPPYKADTGKPEYTEQMEREDRQMEQAIRVQEPEPKPETEFTRPEPKSDRRDTSPTGSARKLV